MTLTFRSLIWVGMIQHKISVINIRASRNYFNPEVHDIQPFLKSLTKTFNIFFYFSKYMTLEVMDCGSGGCNITLPMSIYHEGKYKQLPSRGSGDIAS